MVRDDASSSSSTSSRVSNPSNAPELPTIRASAAHVAYAIDMGGCMEVIAIGLRTGTIEIQFPNTRPDPGLEVEDGFCDANAAAHQVGTPNVPHKAPHPYAARGSTLGASVNGVCVRHVACGGRRRAQKTSAASEKRRDLRRHGPGALLGRGAAASARARAPSMPPTACDGAHEIVLDPLASMASSGGGPLTRNSYTPACASNLTRASGSPTRPPCNRPTPRSARRRRRPGWPSPGPRPRPA